jgi:hypothetical protein
MTKKELHDSIVGCITLSDPPYPTIKIGKLVDAIWGQPFDGETEKIQSFAEKSLLYEDWLKQADASRPINPTDNTKPSY